MVLFLQVEKSLSHFLGHRQSAMPIGLLALRHRAGSDLKTNGMVEAATLPIKMCCKAKGLKEYFVSNFPKKGFVMKENVLSQFGPLYHNYSLFGVHNEQLPGIFKLNQQAKEEFLIPYITRAVNILKETNMLISFMELFCADGYYAMVARQLGATIAYGVDNNRDGFFAKASQIASALGVDNIHFFEKDVQDIGTFKPVDIVANLGGLYHVSNPEQILVESYAVAKSFLIVQSVVSMENNSEDYFEAPAPGWSWGSRYSRESFHKMILAKNWNILDYNFNELPGNINKVSMGSVYYLIKK